MNRDQLLALGLKEGDRVIVEILEPIFEKPDFTIAPANKAPPITMIKTAIRKHGGTIKAMSEPTVQVELDKPSNLTLHLDYGAILDVPRISKALANL